ncbi:acetolactate synthase [Corynespora cassiicola Philippines]|uniref:Acetolactate synthase n=1 Tax=Corynespora cassiicola Philippines TaxID=1448308 RepID=A0A2T2PCY6_CORCC|nr:acetolactate synthase [Corynespora cassiicola Philippines]
MFDAIFNSPHINFILPRHEQGAGHMAQGYSRATGKPGVVLVTSGPGCTNVITPMQDALMDGTPLVVICGQVATSRIGSDAFQEADIVGIASACSKWAVTVNKVSELSQRIDDAFEIATSGRPGPVLVAVPVDVSAARLTKITPTRKAVLPPLALKAAEKRNEGQLKLSIPRVAELINNAKKPIILAGQGTQASTSALKALRSLALNAQIPVTTSLMGLGAFDENDPLSLHMVGLHGSGFANKAIQEADVVVALGARFDDRVTGEVTKFAPTAGRAAKNGSGGIIHFDISPKNVNKVVEATEVVIGDLGNTLPMLLPHINTKVPRDEWLSKVQDWKKRYDWPHKQFASNEARIKPQTVVSLLSKITDPFKDRTIITTGVGQHQMWAAQYFRWRYPRTLITSGGLGTMGFGLPSAIGAKIGHPECEVINIDGDASFCMSLTELATASENGIAVKTIILNNNEQGMVTQIQDLYYKSRYAHTHQKNPDFVKVAASMGVDARKAERPDEVEEKLRWLLDAGGPALLEVMVDAKVPVLPTVPSGKGLHEFMF